MLYAFELRVSAMKSDEPAVTPIHVVLRGALYDGDVARYYIGENSSHCPSSRRFSGIKMILSPDSSKKMTFWRGCIANDIYDTTLSKRDDYASKLGC